METMSRFFKDKLYMWYKVRELQSKGLNKTQTGKYLGVDRSTVRRYLQMSREEFVRKQSAHRKYELKLGKYEEYDDTNRFYLSLGFQEFEVFPTLWDAWNPCQIYIMTI